MWQDFFYKDSLFDIKDKLDDLAKKYDTTSNAIALRWIVNHSELSKFSDKNGVILGGSKPSQIEENAKDALRGPLPDEIVEQIEKLWETVAKDDEPAYHM